MNKFALLKRVTDNFLEILHELYGFYYDGFQGFRANKVILKNEKQNGSPGKILSYGKPDDPNPVILHKASIDDMILRNMDNGSNVNRLRGYMIIMICEHWNAKIRGEIAKVFSREENAIKSDIMGNINKIRNDLLHNRGKSNHSASNKIIKFEKGTLIRFEEKDLDKIFTEIFKYINQLFEQEFGKKCYANNSLNQRAIQKHLAQKHHVISNIQK